MYLVLLNQQVYKVILSKVGKGSSWKFSFIFKADTITIFKSTLMIYQLKKFLQTLKINFPMVL